MIKEKKRSFRLKKILSHDKIYTMYLKEKIRESEEQIRRGEVITIEELKEFIEGLGEKYEDNNTQKSQRQY